jgi:hypothetical protein
VEFVIVRLDHQKRRVFIDNQKQGMTGARQSVAEGMHIFDLGDPVDYTPESQEVEVTGTSASDPMIIEFAPVPVEDAVPPPPKRAKRAKKRPRKAAKAKAKTIKRKRATRKRRA